MEGVISSFPRMNSARITFKALTNSFMVQFIQKYFPFLWLIVLNALIHDNTIIHYSRKWLNKIMERTLKSP